MYNQLQKKLKQVLRDRDLLDREIHIETSVLKPEEAIGTPERQDFPLLKGREVLMQATFMDSRGQAYTDAPSRFSGHIGEIADLELKGSRQTALFIAALNAVFKHVYPDLKTIHCKDEDPERCAQKIAEYVQGLTPASVGIVGLQPAILESITKCMGPDRVYCIDRDEDIRGQIKYGVPIEWGDDRGLKQLFEESALVLATGSSAANGSLPDILSLSAETGTPVYFYGITIAGTARLMGLNHLCYESR